MSNNTSLDKRVRSLYDELHQLPEAPFEEVHTAGLLADGLHKAGYEVTTGLAKTGVVGVLRGTEPGPVVAVRADMDALPHVVDGVELRLHTCGHDAHCAMLLSAAEEVARKGLRRGTLKIIFQPAEEVLKGARAMIADGVVEGVDYIFGMHVAPTAREGHVGEACPAKYTGAATGIHITLRGKTAHAARPHLGINTCEAAAAITNAICAIHINPEVCASVKVTSIVTQSPAINIIPECVRMTVDVRSQRNDTMAEVVEKTRAAIEYGAQSVGATAEIEIGEALPAAELDDECIALAREAITAVLGHDAVLAPSNALGCEDFHCYKQHRPAMKAGYISLGAEVTPAVHNSAMSLDPACLINGVRLHLYTIEKMLGFLK